MNEATYTPTPQTAKRAVELWKRMLRNPKYDNLGNTGTEQEKKSCGLASVLASMVPNNATEEKLEEFGEALLKALLDEKRTPYKRHTLAVDYGPDEILAETAKAVGLKMEFPWKTVMHVFCDCVVLRYGYGAESVYHYPLKDGRWLVTTLNGSEISKIIEYAETGQLPGFRVEE